MEQPPVFEEHVGLARLVARRENLYVVDAQAARKLAGRLGEAVSHAQAVATQEVIREIAVSDVEPRGCVEVHERVPHPERLLAEPQPRSESHKPARAYVTESRSGQTRRPCQVRSSPTFATTASLSGPRASRRHGASRAPPRPPVKRTICDSEAGMGPFSVAGLAV